MYNNYKKMDNPYLNLFRFLFCFFIVGSHCLPIFKNNILNYYYGQWFFRISVPFFFIITGYYFDKMSNDLKKKYIKRTFVVYVLSTLLYLPLIIKYSKSVFQVILCITLGYHHLWYISSLLLALILIYYLENRFFQNKSFNIIIIIFLIIIGAFIDEYYKLFNLNIILSIGTFFNTYLYGGRNFLFLALSMILTGKTIQMYKNKKLNKWLLIFIFIISSTLSFFECWFMRKNNILNITNDITLFNTIPAIVLFIFLNNITYKNKLSLKSIRKISDYVYIIHPLIIYFLTTKFFIYRIKLFIISSIISIIISILFYLSKYFIKRNINKQKKPIY